MKNNPSESPVTNYHHSNDIGVTVEELTVSNYGKRNAQARDFEKTMQRKARKMVIAGMDTPKYGETLRDTLTGTSR